MLFEVGPVYRHIGGLPAELQYILIRKFELRLLFVSILWQFTHFMIVQ